MTPKEVNDLKKKHNALQAKGKELYAQVEDLHRQCLSIQKTLEKAEGLDYDPIPLMFGDGFWIDPDID